MTDKVLQSGAILKNCDLTGQADLATLDRKITAELAPSHAVPDDRMGVNHEEQDGEEVNRNDEPQQSQRVEVPAQSLGSKESMD